MEVVVHLNGGCPAAGADALDFFKGENSVRGYTFMADAELFLELLKKIVSAAQHAANVGADLHVVFAGGLETQHRVIGCHVADVELGDTDAMGDLGNYGVGEIADFVLRVEQHWDEGRSAHGVFFDERVEAGREFGREDAHCLGAHCIYSLAQVSAAMSITSSPLALRS